MPSSNIQSLLLQLDIMANLEIKVKVQNGTYGLKVKSGKSDVWTKFSVVVGETGGELPYVACNGCKQVMTYTHQSGCSHLQRYVCFPSYYQIHILHCNEVV